MLKPEIPFATWNLCIWNSTIPGMLVPKMSNGTQESTTCSTHETLSVQGHTAIDAGNAAATQLGSTRQPGRKAVTMGRPKSDHGSVEPSVSPPGQLLNLLDQLHCGKG